MPHFENEFARFWIENQILYFVYKPGVVVNIRAAKKIVSDRLKFQQEVAYPVFCDVRGITDSDKAARSYLANEGSVLVKAVSVLVESPVTRSMLNFYLRMSKPLVPTQIFTDKVSALKYLEAYVNNP
jgi:hypothetical protein